MRRMRGRVVPAGVSGLNLCRADFYAIELSFQVRALTVLCDYQSCSNATAVSPLQVLESQEMIESVTDGSLPAAECSGKAAELPSVSIGSYSS